MFSGHPILDEIKKGFKLRPTKTVDKSKPVIVAENEDESEVNVTKAAPPSGIAAPGQAVAKPAPFVPPPIPNGFVAPPVDITPGVVPPPPPMFGLGGIPPPPPMMGGIPPPPPMGGAPPPPPPIAGLMAPPAPQPPRPKTPLNPALAKLGGRTPGTVDRGEFLKGIQGGFKLKKTTTNDKSGLFVDDEMRERSVTLVEAAPSSYIAPDRGRSPARPHSSLGFGADDDRFRNTRTPEPRDDSPEQLLGQRRPIVMRQKGAPPPPPAEFGFDSEKIKITSEDIEKEIKKGSVASKMAALMGNMGYSAEKCEQVGTGTLPRATFRRSPLRSSMMSSSSEVNNNADDNETPKPKPVSKWHVDTNYGLKSASRSNVPIVKEERASSVMRDRSSSWLDLTRPSIERARTQSPIPLCERLELDEMDFDQLVDEVEREQAAAAARAPPPPVEKPPPLETKKKTSTTTGKKKAKPLPEPISVKTEFCTTGARRPSTTPQIQETPPTPAQKKTYGYASNAATSKGTNTWGSTSPSGAEPASGGMSPISSMSSASAPSPSSLSAGSVSPDSTPKKRIGANPNFEKAKEKWGAVEKADDSPPLARSYLSRESKTPTREETTPVREKTPVKTEEPKTKKVTSVSSKPKETKEKSPPCFAVTAAEAKGAAAVAKAKRKKSLKTSTTTSAPTATPTSTTNKPTSTSAVKPNTSSSSTEHSPSPATQTKRASISNSSDVKKKAPYGTPQAGTVADRANRFRQQLQADDDKGKKPWQHPFMSPAPLPPMSSSPSLREQLFNRASSQQRVINVPISAPWYSREPLVNREPPATSSSPTHSPRLSNAAASKYSPNSYRISFDEFSVPHPSQMRDHIRFNIDLSHDLPLSISRR